MGLPSALSLSAMSRAAPDGSPRWPTCLFPAALSGAGLGMSPSGVSPVSVCCQACGRVVEWPSPLSLLPSGVPRSVRGFESRVIGSTASRFVVLQPLCDVCVQCQVRADRAGGEDIGGV